MSSTLSAARRAKFIELRRESHANEFLPCSTPDNHSPISGRADQAPGADCFPGDYPVLDGLLYLAYSPFTYSGDRK